MAGIDHLYPTPAHKNASLSVVEYFSGEKIVKSILLTCSCARGRATKDSCLDISILADRSADSKEITNLQNRWEKFQQAEPVFQALKTTGKYSQVDLEITDGIIVERPEEHNWTSGPDSFELSIGNLFAYSIPLYGEAYWASIKSGWMPYYDEALRKERLARTVRFMKNNLGHIPPYIQRELFFQCHKRLVHAFEEFLQALFMSRKVYPIAYDKHIKEQIVEILKLPELYDRLPHLFEISRFESDEILDKSRALEALANEYLA